MGNFTVELRNDSVILIFWPFSHSYFLYILYSVFKVKPHWLWIHSFPETCVIVKVEVYSIDMYLSFYPSDELGRHQTFMNLGKCLWNHYRSSEKYTWKMVSRLTASVTYKVRGIYLKTRIYDKLNVFSKILPRCIFRKQ